MAWFKSILVILIGVVLGFILSFFFDGYWGIGVLTACILVVLYRDYKYYQATLQWANNTRSAPPPYVGHYDEIITPLYKVFRGQRNEILRLEHTNTSILSAAEALSAAAVTMDKNFTIEWCNRNAKKLLGIDYLEDRGFNLFNIIRIPEFYEYAIQKDWSKAYTNTAEIDGRTYHLRFELTQYDDNSILLLCIDNTQLEKLRTTQQDFVANVSHEIRTPLTVLIGFLETISELPPEALTIEQRRQYQILMKEQADRMLAIVADLLTLSTLESTKLQNGVPVKMVDVIQIARQQAEVLSNDKHSFDWEVAENIYIEGNYNELSSAITNLVTNAVRYTPTDGNITVRWYLDAEGQAVFSVKDSGIGIAARDIPRLTERFYRVDKSRSRASGGTGLGLAITKHILIRHNAKLQITSKVNKGSTFSIIFPQECVTIEQDSTPKLTSRY